MPETVRETEIFGESEKSWEDATQKAISEAANPLRDIKSVSIHRFDANVEGDKVTKYRINATISFVLK